MSTSYILIHFACLPFVSSFTAPVQVQLLSKDYGKHLLEVEDLLQKHSLQEADIAVQAERVESLNKAALKFTTIEGKHLLNSVIDPRIHYNDHKIFYNLFLSLLLIYCLLGYQPCDPQVICNRVNHVSSCLEELKQLASKRCTDLEESRQLWAFLQVETFTRARDGITLSK